MRSIGRRLRTLCSIVPAPLVILGATAAHALGSLTVIDQGDSPVAEFRWLLEEDTTHPVNLGAVDASSLGVSVHSSHAPVVKSGTSASLGDLYAAIDPSKRYFVSVLPGLPGGSVTPGDFTLGGAPIAAGQASATVRVHANPVPSARMSVYAFMDDRSINSEPDIGAEAGIPNAQVKLYDALLGEQSFFDFCGNALGTTYNGPTCDDVDVLGNGDIRTGPLGEIVIENLYPGKYAVEVIPSGGCPGGAPMIQTSTLEGTPEVDAWIESGGPQFLPEFGYLLWHVFHGFVCPKTFPNPGGNPAATVHGFAVQNHRTTPPLLPGFIPGVPIKDAVIGVNKLAGNDEQVYTGLADPETGEFTIENVPPGLYQLVIWDRHLDVIINFRTFSVNDDGDNVEFGRVPSNMWRTRAEGFVFYDTDEDGFRDPGEVGLPNQALDFRFRDGSVYAVTETQTTPEPGYYSFDELFPFLKYLVFEINFDRFKATGASFQPDRGGMPGDPPGILNNPQTPPPGEECGDDASFRCETGVVLLETYKSLIGQNNRADWGKKNYVVGPDNVFGTGDDIPGENGGLAGIVYYASTRAEFDPRFAAGDDWEPGVPRAQVVLYADSDNNGAIDDTNGSPGVQLADVDNHPLGWSDGGSMGPEDVDRDGLPGFGLGDALEITHTDSFDDTVPDMAPCPGPPQEWQATPLIECAETLQTGSQIRPQVFDGGYAFEPPPGRYIVEAVAPPGYEHVRDGDLNVLTGDSYVPAYLPAECVGDLYAVPTALTIDGVTPNDSSAAGGTRKLCDRKQIRLAESENQALVDFFVFTPVPKAGRFVGLITNDVQGETDPTHPRFVDKVGPAWVPVSIRDFADNEISRVYTDEFGEFNALVPSSWTASVPSPSGFSPNMVKLVLNPPTFQNGSPDPNHDASYMTVTYTREIMPGKTTYLDVPTLPKSPRSAILGSDCAAATATPIVARGDGPTGGPVLAPGDTLTLQSVGVVLVPNPAFTPSCNLDPTCTIPPTIVRNYGFGTSGAKRVTLGGVDIPVSSWTDETIVATVPLATPPGPHQLDVTRQAKTSPVGLTIHVLGPGYSPPVVRVSAEGDIQAAIDGAAEGTLILLESGFYKQNPLVWKRVKLQGYGARSTFLDGTGFGPSQQAAWKASLEAKIASGAVDLLPGQDPGFGLANGAVVAWFGDSAAAPVAPPLHRQLDGLSIRGGTRGGGVFANAYVPDLEISNDLIHDNQGNYGGGVRIGTPTLYDGGVGWLSAANPGARIHDNAIVGNGSVSGGGGIALFNGSDGYQIRENLVCGNFSLVYGGGIQHFGLSPGGLVEANEIRFNQAFDEGGGVLVGSEPAPAAAPPGTLPPGAGSVTLNRNRLLGNLAFDDGGGIQALDVNGQDVAASSDPATWYRLRITNNLIVNNVSNDVAGGIHLDDTIRAEILHNTIAYNQSTATNEDNFAILTGGPVFGDPFDPENLGASTPLPAGLASRPNASELQALLPPTEPTFSQPLLYDNVLVGNRAFYFDANAGAELIAADGPDSNFTPPPGQDDFFNLGVYGGAGTELLDPRYCALTNLGPFSATNVVVPVDYDDPNPDDLFVTPRVNSLQIGIGGRGEGPLFTVSVEVLAPTAYDYHLRPGSDAIGTATGAIPGGPYPELAKDFDLETRPVGLPDIGADEKPSSGVVKLCGFGPELALVVGVLLSWRRRRNGEGAR